MTQGAYPPGGYEPVSGGPSRPEDGPEPPARATARVPQPPAWTPPQPAGGFGGPPTSAPPGFGGPPPAEYGAPAGRASASASVPGGFPPPSGQGYQSTYSGPEPSRFANLRYDDPAIESPRRSKRGLIVGVVIAAVVVLALAGVGIFMVLNKASTDASFPVNSCVKKSGDLGVAVACSDPGAYRIVSKVGDPNQCPDPTKTQPHITVDESGKPQQILCLEPVH